MAKTKKVSEVKTRPLRTRESLENSKITKKGKDSINNSVQEKLKKFNNVKNVNKKPNHGIPKSKESLDFGCIESKIFEDLDSKNIKKRSQSSKRRTSDNNASASKYFANDNLEKKHPKSDIGLAEKDSPASLKSSRLTKSRVDLVKKDSPARLTKSQVDLKDSSASSKISRLTKSMDAPTKKDSPVSSKLSQIINSRSSTRNNHIKEPKKEPNVEETSKINSKSKASSNKKSTIKPKTNESQDKNSNKETSKLANKKGKSKSNTKKRPLDSIDSDASDLEEVDELTQLLKDENGEDSNSKVVKIELKEEVLWGMKKKKKRTNDELWEDELRKMYNRNIRSITLSMHKTHLLCLFAHGRYVNEILNSPILMASALSIVTNRNVYPPKRLTITHLQQLIKWYNKVITISDKKKQECNKLPLIVQLQKAFDNKSAINNNFFVYMFVILTRALGMDVRLVLSLRPMTWKPSTDLLQKPKKDSDEDSNPGLEEPKPNLNKQMPDLVFKNENPDQESQSDEVYKDKSKPKKQSTKKGKKKPRESELDSDFEDEPIKYKSKKKDSKAGSSKDKDTKSSSSNTSSTKKTHPFSAWVEVYVEEEEKWVCVDIQKEKVHSVEDIRSKTPAPIAYVVAYNSNLSVKDVTRRYVHNFLPYENKLRPDSDWWKESLRGFLPEPSSRNKKEDKEMEQNLQTQPLPKSVSEYKNHPLYALQRHLLKFEAIYPPDESPVGYYKGEPVFPRESVKVLRGREYWIKDAKVVKVGEEPYKLVKARPKYDRLNKTMITNVPPLELFGEWQVEDYVPPVAKDGRVPVSEYGTVELYKPSMLPIGCIHIEDRGPGFAKLARRLGIHIVSALTGFDFHKGFSHPIYEGYVICQENEQVLLDAWQQEQIELAKKEEEKRIKAIYDKWKRLIQGMMIKMHIKQKYGVHDEPEKPKVKKTPAKKKTKPKTLHSNSNTDNKPASNEPTKSNEDKIENKSELTKNVLKIDTNISAVDVIQKEKNNRMSDKPAGISLSDSEEEFDADKHEEKVQQLFKLSQPAEPDLSDDSDTEMNTQTPLVLNKSRDFEGFSPGKSTAKSKNSKVKKPKKQIKDHESDSDELKLESKAPSRRSSRQRRPKSYNDAEDSEPDISCSDDDVQDKSFDPLKMKTGSPFVKDTLDLSEDDSD